MANKMSDKELSEWNELYAYVRIKIMGYDDNQSLSRSIVLRLKGLATNKYMENNSIKATAHYSYAVILNAFKYCMPDIQKVLNNSFKDEQHKFNYILKIVEPKINEVYMRMKNAQKEKEKVNAINAERIANYQNHHSDRQRRKPNKKLEDLW